LAVAPIVAIALATDLRAGDLPLWSRAFSFHPTNGYSLENRFSLRGITQTGLHLTGECAYYQLENQVPRIISIEGTRTADGQFWPDVTAQVKNERTGRWETISKPVSGGRRATITVKPGEFDPELFVTLDAFRPLIGKYRVGRLLLKTGDAAEFELKELLPSEEHSSPKNDSPDRMQTNEVSASSYQGTESAADDSNYRRILASKLFVTRADCARISVRPLSKPESALSVYSRRSPKWRRQRSYFVTITEASTSIHQSLDKNNTSIINVDRRTARIPAQTAVALKTLWEKMLSQANPNDAPPNFVNGEAIEFSFDKSPAAISIEELPLAAKEQVITLQLLRNLLANYCDADGDKRATLARQIRENAKNLGNRL